MPLMPSLKQIAAGAGAFSPRVTPGLAPMSPLGGTTRQLPGGGMDKLNSTMLFDPMTPNYQPDESEKSWMRGRATPSPTLPPATSGGDLSTAMPLGGSPGGLYRPPFFREGGTQQLTPWQREMGQTPYSLPYPGPEAPILPSASTPQPLGQPFLPSPYAPRRPTLYDLYQSLAGRGGRKTLLR